jgi:hypothetical protein
MTRDGLSTDDGVMTPREEIAVVKERIVALEREIARLREEQYASERYVMDLADLEYEEVAAVCVAAGVSLEERYGDVEAALERYRYVVKYFPETAAGKKARERIEQLATRSI